MNQQTLRNIYCVGRNYQLHAAELGNAVPEYPMIFMKPTHAGVELRGQEIVLPAQRGEIHYETELVLWIGAKYETGKAASDVISGISLGIDFTLRDVQAELKRKGHPWLEAKGFRSSALLTPKLPDTSIENLADQDFSLLRNSMEVQRGNVREMIFSPEVLVRYVGEYYGLEEGDCIFTGTPAGVRAVHNGDHYQLKWGDAVAGEFTVRLS